MPERRYINPKSICAPPGNFSWVAQAEKTVYLAGQVGIDKDGKSVGKGDAGAQVRQALVAEQGGQLHALCMEPGVAVDHGALFFYYPIFSEVGRQICPHPLPKKITRLKKAFNHLK